MANILKIPGKNKYQKGINKYIYEIHLLLYKWLVCIWWLYNSIKRLYATEGNNGNQEQQNEDKIMNNKRNIELYGFHGSL